MDIFSVFTWLAMHKKGNPTQDLNMLTSMEYYNRIKLFVMMLHEWEDLPDSCDAKFLEETLLFKGKALFVKDKKLGYLSLRCNPSDVVNVYGVPLKFEGSGFGHVETYTTDEAVYIRNNYLCETVDIAISLFASRLADCQRTIDVNIKAQKTPVIIRCGDKDRLSMINIYEDYNGNEPVIFTGNSLDNEKEFKAIKVDAPYVADKIQIQKEKIWDEIFSTFGVNSIGSGGSKKERLITDEVNANNEMTSIMSEIMLAPRREACEQINKKFPELNVSVKKRSFTDEELNAFKGREEE